jgi:hypothetical protein
MKMHPVGGGNSMRTDRHDEAINRLVQFCKEPKIQQNFD